MTLEELLHKLKTLKYKSDLFGKTTEFNVLNNENFGMVENLIREYALDNHDSEMGELKAKLYVYEQIIAKSNFAPFVDDIRQKPQKDILDKIKVEIEQGYCMEENDYDRGRNMGLRIAMQIIDEFKEGNWIVDSKK